MPFLLPSEFEVNLHMKKLYKDMKRQVQSEHKQSWYKIKGFLRTHFKVKSTEYLLTTGVTVGRKAGEYTYKGAKWGTRQLTRHTLGNIPVVSSILEIVNTIYDYAEKGVAYAGGLAEGKIRSKIIEKIAKKGFDAEDQNQITMFSLHKYTAEQCIGNIKTCLQKLRYAANLVEKKNIYKCDDFLDHLHNLAWFEYRQRRLYEEIGFLEQYLKVIDKKADECKAVFDVYKKAAFGLAVSMLSEKPEKWHEDCGETCMVYGIREHIPRLKMKPLPTPPRHVPKKPLPPLPRRFPTKPLPPRPPRVH